MKKVQENTRKKLLETAAEEFARLGYARTNINEVSQKAGFGKGTVYNYFKNKFDLFISVFRTTMEEIAVDIRSSINEATDPVEKLKQAILADFSWFEKNRDLTLMILRESYSAEKDHQSEFIQAAAPLFQLYMELIQEGIDRGYYSPDTNPFLATIQFIGMSENLILIQSVLDTPLGSAEELARTVMKTFIHGIEKKD